MPGWSAWRSGRAGHGARTVIIVAFACVAAAMGSWAKARGEADVVALYDQSFELVRTAADAPAL
ncbi:hypothetical protein [Streptomyces sp. L-9-10]|uniref:hypothetical protein n=1 Tax=Streptomyces sp. L-9-10 TaxID=1478131 RepID=UPI00101DA667|nr:hypothetical protein [Streptomyces sp. L-9-10]